MIRKVMHLVRTVELSDQMEVVVEHTDDEKLKAIDSANLWSFLNTQEILPVVTDETDEGVEIYFGEYDPDKHKHLPLVEVAVPAPALPSKILAKAWPKPSPNMIQTVVALTRNISRSEVIRVIAQGQTLNSINEVDSNEFWWKCSESGVPVEKDEQWEPTFSIEYVTYNSKKHFDLPLVTLPERLAFENGMPTLVDSTPWHPSTTAKDKDESESSRVGRIVHVEANECYFNVRRVIRSLPDYCEASYVEGFTVTENGECFEHGWIVKDGKIIDPTLPNGDDSYFAGLEFVGRDGIRQFLSTDIGNNYGNRPFHQAFGWNPGIECQNFLKAFDTAMKYLSSDFGEEAVEGAFNVRKLNQLPWTDDWR